MTFRETVKKNKLIKKIYFSGRYIKNFTKAKVHILVLHIRQADDYSLLKQMRATVRSAHPQKINLTNEEQFYSGKNVLGYPAPGAMKKDGLAIGWSTGQIKHGEAVLPVLQTKTDLEINFPLFFRTYKPTIIVDFGTASGGSAVYYHQLASAYSNPKILSIDITKKDFSDASGFHSAYGTESKIKFIFGKDSIACLPDVKEFLKARTPQDRVFFSFDDLHTYEHTLAELRAYAPLLNSGDVIIMQDTWVQDLFSFETSPLLAVFRFLKDNPDFSADMDFLKNITLPCNFIYGVIVKR